MKIFHTSWMLVNALMIALFALVSGVLFSWWVSAVVFLLGLMLVFRPRGSTVKTAGQPLVPDDGKASGEWLEDWHDDMQRWQIGPYEWRD